MASPLAVVATLTPPRALPRLLPRVLPSALTRWPAESQQRACRNALLATTALTQLRHERDEVEQFLDAHARRWARASGDVRRAPAAEGTARVPLRAAL